MAPPLLSQLIPPVTADEAKAVLLSTLQGVGPVQQIGQGAGTLVVTGSPLAPYDVVLDITTGGAPGTAFFQYALDGGVVFAGPYAVPSNGIYNAVGTGLVFNFAGVFEVGDQYILQTVWPPFPVTDWESGSGGRTFTEADAAALADLAGNTLGSIAAGGLNDYAEGIDNNPGAPDWLSLLAHEVYENDRFSAQAARGLVALTLAATAAPLTINANDLTVSNGQGSGPGVLTYQNVDGPHTLTPGTTTVLAFQATQPGAAYNVQNNVLTVLKTPRPGLTCNNPPPGVSAVVPSGGATGVLTFTGTPNGNYTLALRVLSTGGLGVGIVQYSLDGGNNYASPFTIPASGNVQVVQLDGATQTGLSLGFSGSFTSGDSYAATAFQSWVTTPGLNTEGDMALRARDSNKWTAISLGGGTAITYDYLARAAPGGSEVTKTASSAAPGFPLGQINLTVAGYNGPVSSSALASITTFVQQRTALCAKSVVSNAGVTTIAVVGTVFVPAAQLSAAKTAIAAAFQALVTTTPIGGKVFWSDIELALDQTKAGVRDVYLTMPPPNTDTQLGQNNVAGFDLTGVVYQLV